MSYFRHLCPLPNPRNGRKMTPPDDPGKETEMSSETETSDIDTDDKQPPLKGGAYAFTKQNPSTP
jgi:hypothetical protein